MNVLLWRAWTPVARVAAIVTMVTVIPLVAITGWSIQSSHDAVLRTAREQTLQRAHGTAQVVETLIAERLSDLQAIALSPTTIAVATAAAAPSAEDARRAHQLLERTQEAKGFAALTIVASDGNVVSATRGDQLRGGLAAHYLVSALAGEPVLDSPRFLAADGQIYLHGAYPIRAGDAVVGAVVGRFTLVAIDRAVAADTNFAGRNGYGVLFDADGVRLSVPARPAERFRPLEPLPDSVRAELVAEQRFGPRTAALLSDIDALPGVAALGRWLLYDPQRVPFARIAARETYQASVVPLPRTRWAYAIITSDRAIFAGWRREASRAFVLLLVIVALTVTASTLTARWMSTFGLREHAARLEETVGDRTAALKTSEEQMRAVLRAVPDVLLRLDAQGRVVEYLSDPAGDVFGPADGVVGRTIETLVPAGIAPAGRAAIAKALDRRGLEVFEFERLSNDAAADHGVRTYEARLYPDGETTVLCMLRDTTSLRRAERNAEFLGNAAATLSRSLDLDQTVESLARLAVPTTADVCVIDVFEDGRLRTAAVAGVTPEREAAALQVRTRFPVDPAGSHPVAVAARTGRPHLAPAIAPEIWRAIARSPEHAALLERVGAHSSMAVPLVARGKVVGVMGFLMTDRPRPFSDDDLQRAQDLAARAAVAVENARLYRELLLANRMKDEFLGIVSHELRTPLNAVLGWARLLRADALDPGRREHALAAIERNASSQRRLIEDLLDASRIMSGKLQLDVRPIEIGEVIDAALDSIRPAAQSRSIALDTALDGVRSSIVCADGARLQQVFWNLLSNAVKFTHEGGRITVAGCIQGDRVEVTISDPGVGIDPSFLPFVFERFRQADSTTTRAHGGLGLGLAIARHIVEAHDGTIRAASEGEERGASFTVAIPLHTARAESGAHLVEDAAAAGPPPLERQRVLVVDDEEDARALVATVLEAHGATVACAESAEQALRLYAAHRPTVVLADIGMPREDGYGFMHRLRKLEQERGDPPVPVIALTAYARPEDRRRARAEGFAEHLAKPFDTADLIRAIAAASRDLSAGAGSH